MSPPPGQIRVRGLGECCKLTPWGPQGEATGNVVLVHSGD